MCLAASNEALGRAERASNASSGGWEDLTAILGESVSDTEAEEADSTHRPSLDEHAAQIEVRTHLSHEEFAAHYRHKRPVLLRGFAADWPALADLAAASPAVGWSSASHLRGLLDETVLVLRAPDELRAMLCRDDLQEAVAEASPGIFMRNWVYGQKLRVR